MKTALRLGISIAISALFLYFTFRHVDAAALKESLSHVRIGYVALFVALSALSQLVRGVRWHLFLTPFSRATVSQAININNMGGLMVLLLPLRMGEITRPLLLKRDAGAPMSSTLGTVVVERCLDGLMVCVLFFASAALMPAPYIVPPALRAGAFAGLGVFVAASVVAVAASLMQTQLFWLMRKVGKRVAPHAVEGAIHLLQAFVTGLRALPTRGARVALVFWSLATWALSAGSFYALTMAFDWHLPPIAGLTLVCVLVFGVMIPAGPGFLGTFQGALMAALAIYGIGPSDAAAYTMLAYPCNLVMVTGLAAPYLLRHREGLFRNILQPQKAVPA